MRKFILAAALASFTLPLAVAPAQAQGGPQYNQNDGRYDRNDNRRGDRNDARRNDQRNYGRYDYNRPDPRYGNYRADRYYVQGNQYRPRVMNSNERIYRGQDNRYYCRRNDGTTGLVIGGLAGGLLGNTIAPGGSKVLGTVIGGGAGALIGQAIGRDSGNNRPTCR
ncbi:glycine zipper 2TM domain-containing protein [Sphingomonas paeninsulae]|uniref:17 kDa surface antigen n=1 Tax=Sphingomonas paeninsulae TaxID=2319844 RepID=A0A494TFZ8_SPHPE|nr:glycine zipper 2TM domain-containing protein [Sphingomonas paeninsulae]AYJ86314.1 glycine zipper 2TM domain-containing protein [Sphingomonas paeninsulae]